MHISIVLFLVIIVPVFPFLRGPVAPRGPSAPRARGPLGAPGPAAPPGVAPPPTSAPDGGNNLVDVEEESARTFFPESWIWAIQKTE